MEFPDVLTVKVTETDIRCGVRSDTRYCPVARAIRRIYHNQAIKVRLYTVTINGAQYKTSQRAQDWITRFDGYKRKGKGANPVMRPAQFRFRRYRHTKG